jgi:hypothetical protein
MKVFLCLLFLLACYMPYSAALQAKSLVNHNVPAISQPIPKGTFGADPAWCPTCVSFISQSINQLLNIIANAGVIGGCADLCGLLPNQVEATVCDLVCAVVGLQAFVDLVEDADPDPIWICEEVDICPVNDKAAAAFTSVTVSPKAGPQGTSFTVNADFKVTNTIGTGELDFAVVPPAQDGFVFGSGELIVNVAPGAYGVKIGPISTQPNEQEAFGPGSYQVQVFICEGACGSTHSNSFQLAYGSVNFTITQ